MKMSSVLRSVAIVGVLACAGAGAADFPSRPIQLVLPFGAGVTDVLARTLSSCMSQGFGQPVIVINKPGASGLLAANQVKAAAPDGHTLMMGTSIAVTELATRKEPGFDVRRDMESITRIANGVPGIYVNAQVPVKSLQELVAYAKANPGKLNYATSGIGSVMHFATESVSHVAGIKMTDVPYAGGTGPLLTALMAGEVQLALTDVTAGQSALDSGKVRMIGVFAKERMASWPDVPAVVEVLPNMADHLGILWYGLFAPARTPPEVTQIIHKNVTGCLNNSEVRAALRKIGFADSQIVGDTPAQFKASIQADVLRLGGIVRERGIQIQ